MVKSLREAKLLFFSSTPTKSSNPRKPFKILLDMPSTNPQLDILPCPSSIGRVPIARIQLYFAMEQFGALTVPGGLVFELSLSAICWPR